MGPSAQLLPDNPHGATTLRFRTKALRIVGPRPSRRQASQSGIIVKLGSCGLDGAAQVKHRSSAHVRKLHLPWCSPMLILLPFLKLFASCTGNPSPQLAIPYTGACDSTSCGSTDMGKTGLLMHLSLALSLSMSPTLILSLCASPPLSPPPPSLSLSRLSLALPLPLVPSPSLYMCGCLS